MSSKFPDIFDICTESDFPDDIKVFSDVLDFKSALKLYKECPGLTFYIPRLSSNYALIAKFIKANSNLSIHELTTATGLSPGHLSKIRQMSKWIDDNNIDKPIKVYFEKYAKRVL